MSLWFAARLLRTAIGLSMSSAVLKCSSVGNGSPFPRVRRAPVQPSGYFWLTARGRDECLGGCCEDVFGIWFVGICFGFRASGFELAAPAEAGLSRGSWGG